MMEPKDLERLPTWVEIDLDTWLANVAAIQDVVGEGVGIQLTVKADAYGHGAVQLATAAADVVDCFGVATVDEAVELSEAGVRGGISILSPILPSEIDAVIARGFAVTVATKPFIELLAGRANAAGKTVEVCVEVDTGMGRTGVLAVDAGPLIRTISELPGVRLGGVFSHFPVADEDVPFTRAQVNEFGALVTELRDEGHDIPVAHIANSAAIPNLHESHLDRVRPGLLAYGHVPGGGNQTWRVRPIMSWKTRVVQVRELPAGRTISYGRTFTTERPSVIGVLPVGYGHGYPFRLSNTGKVLIGGEFAPIVGRVTMDMTMVDFTDLEARPVVGDEVVLIGAQGDRRITVDDVADWAGTLSYEILCGISKRVPRLYRRHGRIESMKYLLGVVSDDA